LVKRALEADGFESETELARTQACCRSSGHYTHEAGVRNLEREIQNIAGRWRARSSPKRSLKVEVTATNVNDFLGVLSTANSGWRSTTKSV